MSSLRPFVAVVTGGSKGIGKKIVKRMVLKYPNSPLGRNGHPLLVYLTSRDKINGEEAIKQLNEELLGFKGLGRSSIESHSLDISDKNSISQLFKDIKERHGRLNILINNAGVSAKGYKFDDQVVKKNLDYNYYGTLNMINEAIPLMKDQEVARIVNLSSFVTAFNLVSKKKAQQFREATETKQITELLEEYREATKTLEHRNKGWYTTAYAVSKIGISALTRTFQNEFDSQGINITMNCCPGWDRPYFRLSETENEAKAPIIHQVETPVFLAIGDVGGIKGAFWRGTEVVEW